MNESCQEQTLPEGKIDYYIELVNTHLILDIGNSLILRVTSLIIMCAL